MTRHSLFAAAAALGALTFSVVPAAGERLIASLSNHRVMVTSNFTGEELVLFGGIEQDGTSRPRRGGKGLQCPRSVIPHQPKLPSCW